MDHIVQDCRWSKKFRRRRKRHSVKASTWKGSGARLLEGWPLTCDYHHLGCVGYKLGACKKIKSEKNGRKVILSTSNQTLNWSGVT